MKNLTSSRFVLAFLFLCSTYANAQKKSFLIGVNAGPAIIDLHGNKDYNDQYKSNIGFSAGINAEYFFADKLSFEAAFLFERKGNKGDITDFEGNPVESKQQLNYLTIPLDVRVYLGDKKLKGFLNAGLFTSYLLSAKFLTDETSILPSMSTDNKDAFKKTDVGLLAGAGLNYTLTEKLNLSLVGRYNYGLLNILKNDSKLSTRSFSGVIGLAYKI